MKTIKEESKMSAKPKPYRKPISKQTKRQLPVKNKRSSTENRKAMPISSIRIERPTESVDQAFGLPPRALAPSKIKEGGYGVAKTYVIPGESPNASFTDMMADGRA